MDMVSHSTPDGAREAADRSGLCLSRTPLFRANVLEDLTANNCVPSIVISVFAIVILSIIGGLFKVHNTLSVIHTHPGAHSRNSNSSLIIVTSNHRLPAHR